MDLSSFLEGGWESLLVVIGILGFIISYFSKSNSATKEQAKPAPPKPKHVHTQVTKKPAKRTVTQGTFTQNKQQDKELAEQRAALQNSIREVEREASRKRKTKSFQSGTTYSNKRARKLRGRLQEAIITKEILDKPVSLRKDR